jgi:outer membrane protein TolC
MRRTIGGGSCIILGLLAAVGCQPYQPKPLTPAAVESQLAVPPADALRVQASGIRHPILPPVRFDDGLGATGITPDQAAVLAVLLNPGLKAERDQRQVAAAQAFAAGILPNPQLNFSEGFPNGGKLANTINEYTLGLSWDITELISHGAKVDAANATAASVDLTVAWQEWQTAQAAKTAAYDLIALQMQLDLAREVDRSLAENASITRAAVDRHEKTVLDQAAAESASLDAHTTVLAAQRDVRKQRLVLNRAIGLPPDYDLPLRPGVTLPSRISVPDQKDLLAGLDQRRLDLMALRLGYESQEQTLRAAVLSQFPKVNIGFNKSRDNSNVRSIGFGVIVDIPIFDQNQGAIAVETATRQRLFDEYVQRVFEARSDLATALDDIDAIQEQLESVEAAIPGLQRLVQTYQTNLNRGNVDVLSYYTAVGNLAARKIDVWKLKQQLMENRAALELATGRYLPDETANPSATTQPAASTKPTETQP